MNTQRNNQRENRGLLITQSKKSQVNKVEENFYTVKSQSGNGEYALYQVDGEWPCECPDHTYRHVKCKPLYALEFSLKMKEQVKANVVIQPLSTLKCVYCSSEHIVKDGLHHSKKDDLQVYLCRTCGKHFTLNMDFEGMKDSSQIITSAICNFTSRASLLMG